MWWQQNYTHRAKITIPASAGGYAAGTIVSASFETRYHGAYGNMRRDRKDLRVVYDNGVAAVEIDRVLTDTATILFRLQAAIPANTASTAYAIYCGHPAETTSPKAEPRNVLSYYGDGDDLASLSATNATVFPHPRPQVLKFAAGPIWPTPNPLDYPVRDPGSFWYDPTVQMWIVLASFANIPGNESTVYGTRDFYNWTPINWNFASNGVVSPVPPIPPPGIVGAAPQGFQIPSGPHAGKWFADVVVCPTGPWVSGGSTPPPWWLSGCAISDNPSGPWTYLGLIIPPGPMGGDEGDGWVPGSPDEAETAGSTVQIVNGQAICFYGCSDVVNHRTCGVATAASPEGPYTKYGPIFDGQAWSGGPPVMENVENPVFKYDPDLGVWYMWIAHIGRNSRGEHETTQQLYWSTNPLSWDPANQSVLIEPSFGKWDSAMIGLPNPPVVKDGMLQMLYDGATYQAILNEAGGNFGHSMSIADAPWPFPWKNGITLAGGTLQSSQPVLVGDGIFKARVRFRALDSSRFGLKVGANSYYLGIMDAGVDPQGQVTRTINGVTASFDYMRTLNHTKTYEFRRTGSTLTIVCSGWQVWTGACTTSPLYLDASGNMVIEEMKVEPSAPVATTLASLESPNWSDFYATRLPITIPGSPSGYAQGQVVWAILETRAPIAAGAMRADRNDLRVGYGSVPVEVDRCLKDTGIICFRLQAAIPANTANTDYAIFYGNLTQTAPAKQNPRNVWPFYADGDDLASVATTGTVQVYPFPKPGFLKLHANPTLKPTPGTGDCDGIRDLDGMLYDNGWYYVWYDGDDRGVYDGTLGWEAYGARTQDFITWQKLGRQITVSLSGSGNGSAAGDMADTKTASAMIVQKFTVAGVTKYYATYLGSNYTNTGVPATPYILHGAVSDNILGPWTKLGAIVPITPGSYDATTTADGMVVTFDGGVTYECYYGTAATSPAPGGNGVALATGPTPSGPFTKIKQLLPLSEIIENPRILYDSALGMYYILINHIGINANGNVTVAHELFWSTDRLNWTTAQKTTSLEPDYGAWDSAAVGLPSIPVVKDGMMYVAYDGANLAIINQAGGQTHRFRSAGMCEAPWPFPWANGLHVAPGATASVATLSGDGSVFVRGRFLQSAMGVFGVKTATSSYYAYADDQSDQGGSSDFLSILVNGAGVLGALYFRIVNRTKTFQFQRIGSNLSIRCSGLEIWSGACDTAPLSFYASGDVVIEEVRVEPSTVLTFALGATTISASPVIGTTVTVSGTCAIGTTVAVTATGGSAGTVTYPQAGTWSCNITGLPDGPTTITATDSNTTSASVTVTAILHHKLRAVSGGTPVYATLSPGASTVGASTASGAGALGQRASAPIPGALATSTAAMLVEAGALSLPGASAAASAKTPTIGGLSHVLRAVAAGPPVYALLVPGVSTVSTPAVAGAAATPIAASLDLPAASATGGASPVSHTVSSLLSTPANAWVVAPTLVAQVPLPGATAISSALLLGMAGQATRLPVATSAAQAQALSIHGPVPVMFPGASAQALPGMLTPPLSKFIEGAMGGGPGFVKGPMGGGSGFVKVPISAPQPFTKG